MTKFWKVQGRPSTLELVMEKLEKIDSQNQELQGQNQELGC